LVDAKTEGHIECMRLLEKAVSIHEKSEDEDSGVILPTFHKSPSQTKSLFSQANSNSIPSSDDSDSEQGDDEKEEFEIEDSEFPKQSGGEEARSQSDSACMNKKTRQSVPLNYRARSYSATQISDIRRCF